MPLSPRSNIKIQQIARMRVAGIKDTAIASHLGYSTSGLARILKLPDYVEVQEAILNGVISKMDESLAGRSEAMHEEFAIGVPLAMRALLDAAKQRKDVKASISAAAEILERDPKRTFSKRKEDQPFSPNELNLPPAILSSTETIGDNVANRMGNVVSGKGKPN